MRKIKLNDKLVKVFSVEIKTIDTESFTLEAVFSSEKEDRHGDVVMQDGWDLKNFKKNPVILNSHNYGDATEVIGKADHLKVVDGQLEGRITFAVNENPKAKIIFDLYAGGFLKAFSVGFMVKKFAEDDRGNTDYFVIEESELLEVSAVSVPANAFALAKAKGIDVDELEEETEDIKDEQDADEDLEDDFEEKDKTPEETKIEEPTPAESPEIETTEAEPEAKAVPAESYIVKVARAVKVLDEERRARLRKAADIVKSLLEGSGPEVDAKTAEQVHKRKVHQAVRELLKTR